LPSGTPMVMIQPYTAYETCVEGGAMGVGSISKVSDACEFSGMLRRLLKIKFVTK